MWRAGLAALLSHWRRHPGQAATLVLGLALATALWTGVQAINAEARASYARAADLVSQNGAPVLSGADGRVTLAEYVALRRAGWAVAPILEGRSRIEGRAVTLLGLDPLSAPVLPRASAPEPDAGGEGSGLAAFLGPPGILYAAPETADWLKGRIAPDLRASEDLAPDTLVGDIGTVAGLLGTAATGDLSRLVLDPAAPPGIRPWADVAPRLILRQPDAGPGIEGLTGSFHLNLTAFGLLSFAVGLFIVHGAIGLAFEQRRGMVRTLRALGLPARVLVALILLELAAVALVAGLAGVALGYLIAASLLPDVAATLRGLYGAPAAGGLALRPSWVAAGLGMAALGTALAAAQALWRLIRLPILAAARPRAWRLASESALVRQGAAAALLLVAAVLAGALGRGLAAGFTLLACLLLGAALALPPLLALVLKAVEARARGPLTQWFWADSRQQLPGLSLALMALLLALSANIGVSTMVGSFRATFTDWLDRRLAADLYVDAGTEAKAAALAPWLAARGVEALPRIATEARLDGSRAELLALPDHPFFRSAWPLLDATGDVWPALARGEGILVNEQFARRARVGPGDRVDLDGRAETVLAVYPDYGNPLAQAVIGAATFARSYPDQTPTRFGLLVPPGQAEALRAGLIDDLGLPPDQVIDQAGLKALSLAIFERTFAVTGALNALTLGVAAVAIFTGLATLAGQRLPQVAPVWALGLTRARLGWIEIARAGMLALLTAALALPVGLALAWALLAVVNVEAFGWRLPMRLFLVDWLRLTGLALAAALAAAALPARRLATRKPADLLRVFASDR
jgi:putative ABC transport system permease protein